MKKEREAELELVKEIILTHLMTDRGVIDNGGGRFKKSEDFNNDDSQPSQYYEGGKEEDENMGDINEEVVAGAIEEMSVHNTDTEDIDPFIDSRVYLSDFSTLVLNAMIYRLNKILGFETILLMSNSGRNLYLLIRATTGDLK
jgi:hypothetical protein